MTSGKRGPRVHITYDIEVDDAIELRELPFVVGVLAPLTGHRTDAIGSLFERRFVDISTDEFDLVLARMSPELRFAVEHGVVAEPGVMHVNLRFGSLSDFEPARVSRQIPPCANSSKHGRG